MKKLTTVITAIALFFATSAFAKDPETVSSRVKAVFAEDFAKAQQVTWTKTANFYFASFVLNDKNLNAAYDEKGELAGTSRELSLAELPMNVSMGITKKYAGYEISQKITEVSFQGQTSYFFTAANDKQILNIKSDADANFTTRSKIKK